MPKRQNPFGDSSPLQFKSRIRTKEVNLGVCVNEKMQSVYEKTKAKMFEGARRRIVPEVESMCLREPVEIITPLPGQLRLDAGGNLQLQLSSPPQELSNVAIDELGVKRSQEAGTICCNIDPTISAYVKPCSLQGTGLLSTHCCYSCSRVSGGELMGCSFCDKRVCPNCTQICHLCKNKYCNVCSVLNYDDLAERAFCLQCSP